MHPPPHGRQAALAHLAATAADRTRLQGRRPNPATTPHHQRQAHHQQCRTAGAALRAAVADAHHAGIPTETIARIAGFSPGYVRMILHREHTPAPSRYRTQTAPTAPFRLRGEIMSASPPWSIRDHLWRKLGPRNHHLGTITRIWHDGTRWMVEYEHGVRTRETATAPATEMYKAGPIARPV